MEGCEYALVEMVRYLRQEVLLGVVLMQAHDTSDVEPGRSAEERGWLVSSVRLLQ